MHLYTDIWVANDSKPLVESHGSQIDRRLRGACTSGGPSHAVNADGPRLFSERDKAPSRGQRARTRHRCDSYKKWRDLIRPSVRIAL